MDIELRHADGWRWQRTVNRDGWLMVYSGLTVVDDGQ